MELAKVLHLGEAFEVQEELLVQFWSPVVLLPLGPEELAEVAIGEYWVTVLIALWLTVLGTSVRAAWVCTSILAHASS